MNSSDEGFAIHPLLEELFKEMDAGGLIWALLRGVDRLSRPTGDVDLLIAEPDLDAFDSIAIRHGFSRQGWTVIVTRRCYLAYVPSDDLWLRLDVVPQVSFGRLLEFDTQLAASVLARRERAGGVAVLEPNDGFWHLLLHYMLDKGVVPDRWKEHVARVAELSIAIGPIAEFINQLGSQSTSSELLEITRRSEWSALERMFVDIRASWTRSRTARAKANAYANAGLDRLHLGQVTKSRPGLTVTILGPDGAGKTTLALALRETLGIPTYYVYYGLWKEGSLEKALSRLPGARLLLLLLRLVVRSARTGYHRWRGRIVILDRFTYDAYLVTENEDLKQRITASIVLKLFRSPDLTILLDLPGSVAFARKGEQSIDLIDAWRVRYLRLQEIIPGIIVLDATRSPSSVLRSATQAIWTALSERNSKC